VRSRLFTLEKVKVEAIEVTKVNFPDVPAVCDEFGFELSSLQVRMLFFNGF
jgi:hypothetical protein